MKKLAAGMVLVFMAFMTIGWAADKEGHSTSFRTVGDPEPETSKKMHPSGDDECAGKGSC